MEPSDTSQTTFPRMTWEPGADIQIDTVRVRKANQHGRSVAHDPANVLSLSRSRPSPAGQTDM